MRGEGKKEKRLKKAMIAPLVFILPGYFRFFFFAVFGRKKNLPDGGGLLVCNAFKNPAWIYKQEIT